MKLFLANVFFSSIPIKLSSKKRQSRFAVKLYCEQSNKGCEGTFTEDTPLDKLFLGRY